MKIYTKTGDAGETGLFGGQRVSKSSRRVEAYGAVDELNAQVGWAGALLHHLPLQEELKMIQSDLLSLGADLATPEDTGAGAAARTVRVGPDRAVRLENLIDRWEAETTPLTQFILPGGSQGAAAIHLCRVVCRRAERRVVELAQSEAVNTAIIVYLNRLSDLFFVLARWINAREGVEEPVWRGACE
ncbi:MAG: cob(I)yrinic acid a,c-diamide adenosyltransferase [Armatimonadota bacterium]|nr:cob(I)yrinic acid a,c-diamide adenosyltransferase [Armatimonadota bacterium]